MRLSTHTHRNRLLCTLATVTVLLLLTTTARAQFTNYTWTGGGNQADWTDPANWSSSPAGGTFPGHNTAFLGNDVAIFPDGLGPVTFTNTEARQLNGLQTGNRKITFAGSIQADRTSANGGFGFMTIGSGGVEGTTIRVAGTYGVGSLSVAGNVKANDFGSNWAAPVLSGTPVFDVKNFYLPGDQGGGTYNIPSTWNFINVDANGLIIRHATYVGGSMSYVWTGTPNFNGGRPSYYFNMASGEGIPYDVGPYTLVGNVLQLDGWPGGVTRYPILKCNGGTVDLNEIHIAYGFGGSLMTCVKLTNNATIYIRGTNTTVALPAWDNRSTNNAAFDVRTKSTIAFDTAGAVRTQYVATGSSDLGGTQLTSWNNNFAFDVVKVGTNTTVMLTGSANIGGGVTALYATRIIGLGPGATINRNGRKVYTIRSNSGVTFTGAGSTTVLYPDEPGVFIQQK
jgi:hypothetical protein